MSVELAVSDPALAGKLGESFGLYTVAWPAAAMRISVDAVRAPSCPAASGTYLKCARMEVDHVGAELVATCRSGASASSIDGRRRWRLTVPEEHCEAAPDDVEDLAGLVLTTAWRAAGFVPLHVATLVRRDTCALLCAPSGGGKSTLTAALLREGWSTLGDDKVLLGQTPDGSLHLHALIDRFNLHPQSRRWLPELGNLDLLPRYSAWTEKRKVEVNAVWPDVFRLSARPTHLVLLDRCEDQTPLTIKSMPRDEVLPALLRQTVIPRDRSVARRLLVLLSLAAQELRGLQLRLGRDAYARHGWCGPLEEALA